MANGKIDKALQQLFKQSVKLVKLWENASPTSAFPAQKININLAGYDDIITFFKPSPAWTVNKAVLGKETALECTLNIPLNYGVYFILREVHADSSGATFGDAYNKTATAVTPTKNNGYAIPLEIYGAKLIGGGYNLIRKARCLLHGRGCPA